MSTIIEAAEASREHTFESVLAQIADISAKVDKLKADRDELLALAHQYASECSECGGTGLVTIKTWPGGIEVDNDDQPCPDCADIRRVIAKVEAP